MNIVNHRLHVCTTPLHQTRGGFISGHGPAQADNTTYEVAEENITQFTNYEWSVKQESNIQPSDPDKDFTQAVQTKNICMSAYFHFPENKI